MSGIQTGLVKMTSPTSRIRFQRGTIGRGVFPNSGILAPTLRADEVLEFVAPNVFTIKNSDNHHSAGVFLTRRHTSPNDKVPNWYQI